MRYLQFRQALKDFVVFSLADIRKLEHNFDNRRLVEWQEKGYIRKVIRSFYVFADEQVSDQTLYYIANKIYRPSYISLEMGLSYHNVIPESVYSVTSISTKKTQQFQTEFGTFSYRSVKRALMFGYFMMPISDKKVKMGELEKVVLDYLYLHPEIVADDDLEALRFNRDILSEGLDLDKLFGYARLFDSKALNKRLKILTQYLEE